MFLGASQEFLIVPRISLAQVLKRRNPPAGVIRRSDQVPFGGSAPSFGVQEIQHVTMLLFGVWVARRALERVEGSAPGARANPSTMRYVESGLSL